MDDVPIGKIQIFGPTLPSLLHRFSFSSGSLHGLLFGHVTISSPSALSDDPTSATTSTSTLELSSATTMGPLLTATITSFLSFPSNLPLQLHPLPNLPSSSLLGWFPDRRRTPLRPSLKDSTTTHALSSSTSFSFSQQNSTGQNLSLPPSLFLLIHTHEYKAFQYRISMDSFEPGSLDIINIGPSFRSQYESFSPNSLFPLMHCEFRDLNAMAEDEEVVQFISFTECDG